MSASISVSRPVKDNSLLFTVLATLAAIVALAGVMGLTGFTVSFCYGTLFLAATQVTAILLCGVSVVVAIVARLWSYFRRGDLLCDCGPNPYQKLFFWIAILNIIPALYGLDTARRMAEQSPIRQRIEMRMAQRADLLLLAEDLHDQQKEQIRNGNPSEAKLLGDKAQLALDYAEEFGRQIDSDLVEQRRMESRILPTSESLDFAKQQLQAGFAAPGTFLWETLNSRAGLQLAVGFMMLTIGLTNGVISFGRTQLCEQGLWRASALLSWKHIASYRWENEGTLELTFHRATKPLSLPVSAAHRPAVANALAQHVALA